MDNETLEEVTRLIKEGFTSGTLNKENGKNVSWNLQYEEWDSKDVVADF